MVFTTRILRVHVIDKLRRLKLNEKGFFKNRPVNFRKSKAFLFGPVLLFNFHFFPKAFTYSGHSLIRESIVTIYRNIKGYFQKGIIFQKQTGKLEKIQGVLLFGRRALI